MRIEKIELIGFKSFSERTTFHFHPGITAVVGPNGSGKSNIVDAFRWVLGEQSAKALRGDKMEEVIFSGSTTKKPKGMAEVTLTLSGVYKELPSGIQEIGEISVGRRLYRSGESEYYINKVPCRLKDIRDIFLDTGLELKAYSILEQGRMDDILKAKPYERRFLIEEAAGIMKYKVRKTEALNKLQASQANLQRLNDILNELKRQINSLDRQAKKAERYKNLTEELKAIELRLAKRDYNAFRQELLNTVTAIHSIREKEFSLSAELQELGAEIEKRRLNIIEHEKFTDGIQRDIYSKEKAIAEESGRINLIKNDHSNLKERYTRLIADEEDLREKNETLSARLSELDSKESGLKAEIEDIKGELGEREEALRTIEDELWDIEDSLEEKRKELFSKAEAISNLKNEIANLRAVLASKDKTESSTIDEMTGIERELERLNTDLRENEAKAEAITETIGGLKEKRETTYSSMLEDKDSLKALEEKYFRQKAAHVSLSSKVESLKAIDMDEASKQIMGKGLLNIHGQVADVIETEPAYEKAVEAALGEKLYCLIVQDYDELKKGLDVTDDTGTGRIGFIPLDIAAPSMEGIADVDYSNNGIIGLASNLVRIRDGYTDIALALLGNVIVVSDIEAGINIHRQGRGHRIIATIDGHIMEASGAVFGGKGKEVLKKKRELRESIIEMEKTLETLRDIEDRITSLKSGITDKEHLLTGMDKDIVDAEKRLSATRNESMRVAQEIERYKDRIEFLKTELELGKRDKEEAAMLLSSKEEDLVSLEEQRNIIEAGIKEFQEVIGQRKALVEESRAEITDMKLSLTSIKAGLESISKEKAAVTSSIQENQRTLRAISEEIDSIRVRMADRENESKDRQAVLNSLISEVDSLRKELTDAKEKLETLINDTHGLEDTEKHKKEQLDAIKAESSGLEIKKAETSLRIEHLKGDMQRNYGLDIETLETQEPMEDDAERLTLLREKIQQLGPVSLGTLDEYEELRKRYEFLAIQQTDLLNSIKGIEEAIAKINRTTRKRLQEAYELLRERFREIFTVLFGGGRADIILVGEENILEAGVDIIAQPPGKTLQNLSLLSGGEKALTALALMFAGFLVKPTPLCIMDEVDAPLDESNIDRFASMLKELARDTQFIIITHNRRTMEVADFIYGVTIESAGTSRVLSLKLMEPV